MSDIGPKQRGSVYLHMARGSAWAVAMRWSLRGIGLVSTIILARILSPADFGIVAMNAIVIGFLDRLSEAGVGALLIRESKLTPELCNTGWTMQLLQSTFIAVMLVLIAPLSAWYFHEPRLIGFMQVTAVASLIGGARNIGIVLFRKELDFARDFRFAVYSRLSTFVATVSLALVLRNYWALALGNVASAIFKVLLSYGMHPYRPRISFIQARKFLIFATSIIPSNLASYVTKRVDTLVVGRIASTAQLGLYNLGSQLSTMVTAEVTIPLARALFPSLSAIRTDPKRLAEAYLYTLSVAAVACIALGVGLSLVANDFVAVVLGEKWRGAIPLIRLLAFYGVAEGLQVALVGQIFIIAGRERLGMIVLGGRAVLFAAAVVIGGQIDGVYGVAYGAIVASVGFLPLGAFAVTRVLDVTLRDQVAALLRPVLAAVVMAVVVKTVHVEGMSPLLRLFVEVLTGGLTFAGALFALWWAAGRPRGAEQVVLYLLRRGDQHL